MASCIAFPATTRPAAAQTSIFDEVVDRRGSNSKKWHAAATLTPDEVAADPLPMWVADMDFRAPQAVLYALHEAVDHGVFGYPAGATGRYLDAVTGWQARRFGWDVPRDWVLTTAGVITTLKTAVQAFSAPGDSVLVQPPVYAHFHNDVLFNGRHLACAPLERTADGYRFDPGTFEAAIRPGTKLFILSNPHNPTGNVWSEAELTAMGEICARHGVLVIADEIHQDLIINPARRHVPFASLGPEFARNSITCTAPSKTFNLPGLQCANVFVPDRRLREELARQYERNVFPLVNVLGMVAGRRPTHTESPGSSSCSATCGATTRVSRRRSTAPPAKCGYCRPTPSTWRGWTAADWARTRPHSTSSCSPPPACGWTRARSSVPRATATCGSTSAAPAQPSTKRSGG
jgi:cystathionine beta-lyase